MTLIVNTLKTEVPRPLTLSLEIGFSGHRLHMDTYFHIISGMQEDMMALLDDVLPAGKSGIDDRISVHS
jgi:hypothetical protein